MADLLSNDNLRNTAAGAALGNLVMPLGGTVVGAGLAQIPGVSNAINKAADITGVSKLADAVGLGSMFGGGKSNHQKNAEHSYAHYKSNYNNALNRLNNTSNPAIIGQDNSDLLDPYRNYLTALYQELTDGFDQLNKEKLISKFVDNETSKRKNLLQNWLNNSFAGYGTTNDYLNNYWTTDADKNFNQNFLQGYYDDALSQLDTAKNRGLLNEAGYNSAISSLDRRHSAAQGAINELTDPVLQGYRDDLANTVGGFQSAIDNYSLGQRNIYNSDQFANQYNTLYGQQQNNLESDLNSAVADYTPFSVADILGDARNTQGILTGGEENPELLQSLQDQKKNQQNKVGLGNQGVF